MTTGLKPNQIKRLGGLYRRRTAFDVVIGYELATSLSQISAEIGRQVGLLIDRGGHVEQVVVGDATGLFLPDVGRQRAGRYRLRGLRLVHTHLKESALSRDDLTDMSRLHLDMVAAIEVTPDGRAGLVHMAHLLPPNPKGQLWKILDSEPAFRLELDLEVLIRSLEAEFARKAKVREAAQQEGAILVHVQVSKAHHAAEESLRELERLADTAKVRVLQTEIQRRPQFDSRYLVGKGKLEELVLQALHLDADLIVFDHDLSPAQTRAIGDFTELKVIDRTQLILDIFAQRAQSNEGKLQVELAQLKYMLPRLVGKYGAMIRQAAGGVGALRGPGEKKLEIDRRRMRDRVTRLEKDIDALSKQRENRRALRRRREIPVVAIVGYTNAGKSTLLNSLTRSDVFTEDQLFATLDPTTRRLRFPRDREVILADTVGFIRDLPKDLVNAFRATLEELDEADLLLHLVDAADPYLDERVESVNRILDELGLGEKPQMVVLNKADLLPPEEVKGLLITVGDVAISAIDRNTTHNLLKELQHRLWQDSFKVEGQCRETGDFGVSEVIPCLEPV